MSKEATGDKPRRKGAGGESEGVGEGVGVGARPCVEWGLSPMELEF